MTDKTYIIEVGIRLQVAREAIGISKTDMAKTLGISLQRYANWEYGLRLPSPQHIFLLKEKFGITSDYIWGGDTSGLPIFIAKKVIGITGNQTL